MVRFPLLSRLNFRSISGKKCVAIGLKQLLAHLSEVVGEIDDVDISFFDDDLWGDFTFSHRGFDAVSSLMSLVGFADTQTPNFEVFDAQCQGVRFTCGNCDAEKDGGREVLTWRECVRSIIQFLPYPIERIS